MVPAAPYPVRLLPRSDSSGGYVKLALSLRRFSLAAALCVGLVAADAAVAFATPSQVTSPTATGSCVWSADGHTSLPFNLGGVGVVETFRFKCYYDGANIPSGFGGWLHNTHTSAGWGTDCVTFQYGSTGVSIQTNVAAGTNRFLMESTGLQIDHAVTGSYVDGSFSFHRTQGSSTFSMNPTGGTLYMYYDPDCSSSGTDRYILGAAAYWAGGTSYVSPASFEAAEPAYRWGDAYSPVSPFCGATVTASVAPTWIIKEGDDITFTVNVTSGRTSKVEVMFPGTFGSADARNVLYDVSQGLIGLGPFERTVTVHMPPAYSQIATPASAISYRCYDLVDNTEYFLNLGDDMADIGDGRPRPCDVARVFWPDNVDVAVGDSITYSVQYSGIVTAAAGTSPTIDVEWAEYDPDGLLRYSALTWNTGLTALTLGSSSTFDAGPAAYDGSTQNFVLRCTDYLGSVYSGQWASSTRIYDGQPSGNSDDFDLGSCFKQTGLSLTHPSTWVGGALRGMACVMQYLFVPRASYLDSNWTMLTDEFNDSGLGTMWETGAGVVSFVDDMSAAYSTTCDGDTINLPVGMDGGTAPVSFFNACAGIAQTVRNVVYNLLRLTFLLGGLVAVYNTGMKLIGGGAELEFDMSAEVVGNGKQYRSARR